MYLAIEIGGTKLQLAVGSGQDSSMVCLERALVNPDLAADGIRRQITELGRSLMEQHDIGAIGIGFGGPIDASKGVVIKSYQINGWDGFPIVQWCEDSLGRPTCLGNDSDLAGLGEALFGAGRGHRLVLYSNVGSGIGGSMVIDGHLFTGGSGGAAEIGHLRPGLAAETPEQTVESLASGWGMAAVARKWMAERAATSDRSVETGVADLLQRCGGDPHRLDGKILAAALADGNRLAQRVFGQGIQAYGWALAQAITLWGPHVVVVGGGAPRIGEQLYLSPLRAEIERYVMRPRVGTYEVVPAALGEEVVLHGALAIAASHEK